MMNSPNTRRAFLGKTATGITLTAMAACSSLRPPVRGGREATPLVFSCRANNDFYQIVSRAGCSITRYETPGEAIAKAPKGAGVLLLADGYPSELTPLTPALFEAAATKHLRMYVEFPSCLPDVSLEEPRDTQWERAVVASDAFGPNLQRLRILAVHDCHFVPVKTPSAHIVVARVAGFDTAVYDLPEETWPLLFEHPDGSVLVATTKLSQFVTARYAPTKAWKTVWQMVFGWVAPEQSCPKIDWIPSVRPAYAKNQKLPYNTEHDAMRRGAQWFLEAKLLVDSSWPDMRQNCPDCVGPPPEPGWVLGDGRAGLLEGFNAAVRFDGSQQMRWWLRTDCMCEAMMALAFDSAVNHAPHSKRVANNLGNFVYRTSEITQGPRGNPNSPSYGLLSWDTTKGLGVYYGDDNARALLSTMAASALLKTNRWNENILRCLLANLRTTGKFGFRGERLDEGPLSERGWQSYFEADTIHYAPHFEAYLWACYLWAYRETGYALFLERARNAIRMTMEAYPDQWRWTNGLQQERARILLALAWLVRTQDTSEHRKWLRFMTEELLAHQDTCGAIREELGPVGKGTFGPPKSNAEYGTNEAPLIQSNGDPLCDLLYTNNFALIGLHEATAATEDAFYADAEDKLAQFLCRIQIRSEAHPELDGGWFRAFDFDRWEYWASSADHGWGAWSIESGWTCAWLTSVLALRAMRTTLWDITRKVLPNAHIANIDIAKID